MAFRVLVVDDEVNSCAMISDYLTDSGYEVVSSHDTISAVEILEKETIDLVVADKNMPGFDEYTNEGGMQLLKYVQNNYPGLQVVIMTGFATLDTAIEALRLGAFDYITKPFSVKDLLSIVERLESFQTHINPDNILATYHDLQQEVIDCIEAGRDNSHNANDVIRSVETKIEAFIKKQKDWERLLMRQRDALTEIESQAIALQNLIGDDPESRKILDAIINVASNRL